MERKEEHWKCLVDLLSTFLLHFPSLLRGWQLRVARAFSFFIPPFPPPSSPRDGALPACSLSL